MRIACLLLVALVACGDDGSEAGRLFQKRESKREATEAEHLEARRREIERLKEQIAEEQRSGLKIDLPAGASQEIDPSVRSLIIDIPEAGDVVVAGRVIRDDDLDNLFRTAFTRDPATQVVLRASRGVPHGRVIGIMEKAKAAGLTRLAIATAAAPP